MSNIIESSLREVSALLAKGDLAAARETCSNLLSRSPKDARIWCMAAELELRSGAAARALQILERGLDCLPSEETLLIQLGLCLLRTGRRADALQIALRTARLPLSHARSEDSLGTLFSHLEEPGSALRHFERAVERAPEQVGFRYNLAMAQRMAGDLAASEDNLDKVIAARPEDGEAYNARSDLRAQTPERNHVAQLERALEALSGRRASIPVIFALAKELEDLGDYARSFAHLKNACGLVRSSLKYQVGDDIAVLERLCAVHTRGALEPRRSGNPTEQCIFIIGLPRSGTTLLERILGSHSSVLAAGELQAFAQVTVEAVSRQEGRSVPKLEFVDSVLKLDLEALGRAYAAAVPAKARNAPRFTDKQPMNYLYLGLIHAALPNAPVIFVKRHPLDVCYAMYKTLFAAAYPFSYDLSELAHYYAAWERLMRHWTELLGPRCLAVGYEDLIANPDGTIRRMLAHCGLGWEEDCRDFHASSGSVTTASAVQVRRPLYSDSVGKWRHYGKELTPLVRQLEGHGIELG